MTISVPVDMLKAAILCASTEQTRYYLNGVFLSATGHMVATDGHRIFVARLPVAPAADVIIPLDTIKAALKLHNKRDPQINLTDNCLLGHIAFQPVDGTFPDWRRIIPSGVEIEYQVTDFQPERAPHLAHFNPNYIYDLGQMARILAGNVCAYKMHVWTTDTPAGVTFHGREDCMAVIMPIRQSSDAIDWQTARAIA